jgi:copper(I)-binding protein
MSYRSIMRCFSASSALWFCMLFVSAVHAQATIAVENAWARATVPGQKVGAEIHSMSNEGGVMKMRQLKQLDLPAAQTVRLAPNGNHIMLLDIKQPLQPGARMPLTLIVEQKGKKKWIQVQAEVRAVAP